MGKYIPQLAFLDVLLGSRSAMAPPDQFYQRLLAFREDEATQVAHDFLREHSFLELCDELMVPALVQIKGRSKEGSLDQQHLEFACDTIDDLVADQSVALRSSSGTTVNCGPVVFVPAGDEADETIARMVATILESGGCPCEVLSSQSLAGEIVTQMSDRQGSQICISASPPLAQKRARYLLKRLAVALPDIPVVTALWGASENRVQRFRAISSSAVVTSVKGALEEIRRQLTFPLPEKAVAAPSSLVAGRQQ
jgi:hypothetical protein